MKNHTKDPTPYSKGIASDASRIRLTGELVMLLMKQFKTKEEVEFILENLRHVENKLPQTINLIAGDKVQRCKFVIQQFYKWCGRYISPDFKFPAKVNDGVYYMHVEALFDVPRFLEHAQREFKVRFSNHIHNACMMPNEGISRSTSYLFTFTKQSRKIGTGERQIEYMTCLEYIMCRLFLQWYEGYVIDQKSWTIVKGVSDNIMFGTEQGKLSFITSGELAEDKENIVERNKHILFP